MPVATEISPAAKEEYYRAHRWGAAIKAGLLAGALLLLFPSGNPWTAFSRPSAAHIMGRPISSDPSITILTAAALPAHTGHLAVSVVYALIILAVVHHMKSWRAILGGILTALILYGVNFATFRAFAPEFTGEYEFNVFVAHVLFGGVAAAVIRGFLRPPMLLDTTQPNPGARMADPSRRSNSMTRAPEDKPPTARNSSEA